MILPSAGAESAGQPTLGDVIILFDYDTKGELVLVVDRRRKNGSFKAYLMGIRHKERWGDLNRRAGKSVTLVFTKEEAVPEPVVGDKDATIFCTRCKIIGNGKKFDLDMVSNWLSANEVDVLVDKASEVMNISDDEGEPAEPAEDDEPNEHPKAKPKAKGKVFDTNPPPFTCVFKEIM